MEHRSWAGSVNLETPAGGLLRKLADALPKERQFTITVFGSAPLQITVDSTLTSADVDVFSMSIRFGRAEQNCAKQRDEEAVFFHPA